MARIREDGKDLRVEEIDRGKNRSVDCTRLRWVVYGLLEFGVDSNRVVEYFTFF